ncbi:MAG TPA: FAD synthase [Candidatus Magasanikbacteria bacterium]|nr:MAG: hypothetical protein A3I74_00850 [Candidatus Magasanikbacteria bacterium RIFCSPLOWO2_02_FULL_47_16]OGH80006.1 MAG: hypothetical protein A3C10_02375 [Candidatus Magasanikbacteria bacterium RIFCSPHIGHO2_02_FULL_48_18]OGH82917.1 MAG: hypothetical protein A3G08_04440 [Candidatus Magasanikbacteria bacterium RIFCSPLOWO2_12_FULL_47_9b]HAZ28517.1 FAD synthase [Candidatus Magasanikbacteria bacterium]
MKTVMIFGTFDIVHFGHIHMFEEAKAYGDRLVVVVARDANAEKIKGMAPFHSEKERKGLLTYISLADEVVLGDKNDPYKIISHIKPDIIALGYDQKVFVDKLVHAISDFKLEIRIVRLSAWKPEKFKTSKIRRYIEKVT